jgi:hypothetical protein
MHFIYKWLKKCRFLTMHPPLALVAADRKAVVPNDHAAYRAADFTCRHDTANQHAHSAAHFFRARGSVPLQSAFMLLLQSC